MEIPRNLPQKQRKTKKIMFETLRFDNKDI